MIKNYITKLERFASRNNEQVVSVGVDVHKKSYSVCIYSSSNDYCEWTMPSDNQSLISMLLSVDLDYHSIVYESGPCGFELCRQLRNAGLNSHVIAANKILRPATSGAKTDSIDSRKIAEYALKDMLVPIGIPTREEEIFRKLMRYRHRTTDKVASIKREIKSVYLEMGEVLPEGSEKFSVSGIQRLKDSRPDFYYVLFYMLTDLSHYIQQRKEIDAKLKEIASERMLLETVEHMKILPGVGDIVALSFITEVFQPKRFKSKEQISSYLGLAPINNQSGMSKNTSRISNGGKKRLKSLLVEASWIYARHDEQAKKLYNRILTKTGLPQKAIVAVAHRLGIKLWRLSLNRSG